MGEARCSFSQGRCSVQSQVIMKKKAFLLWKNHKLPSRLEKKRRTLRKGGKRKMIRFDLGKASSSAGKGVSLILKRLGVMREKKKKKLWCRRITRCREKIRSILSTSEGWKERGEKNRATVRTGERLEETVNKKRGKEEFRDFNARRKGSLSRKRGRKHQPSSR